MTITETVKVLDKGFVRLEDWMGGDSAVLRSARVSYGSESVDEARDRKLIAYLLAHQHGTPFEHAVFTFHVKLPIFVARQWIRHRMSSYNETSMRYREAPEEFYIPEKWRAQDTKNKQGSVAADICHAEASDILVQRCSEAMESYRDLVVNRGIAREMARMVLPVNLYTEWYWTVNARSFMHFVGLRSESHAQWEIQRYSDAMYRLFAEKMPWTADAFRSTLDAGRYKGLADTVPTEQEVKSI